MLTTTLAIAATLALLQFPGALHSEATRAESVVARFDEPHTSHAQRSAPPAARTATSTDRALVAIERVSVDRNAIDSTIEALQDLDAQGQDGVVLWIGVIEDRHARVLLAVVFVHDAADAEADNSLVSRDTRVRVNHALSQSGLRLIAEVHSSTTAFRDSDLSSGDVIADSGGALVLIAPIRSRESNPAKWTAYWRFKGGWRSLSARQMQKLLRVNLD